METLYRIAKIHIEGRTAFKVVEVRNPSVKRHSGYFSTRAKAETALKEICWGDYPQGDIDGA